MELYIIPSVVAISAKIALFLLGRKVIANVDKYLLGFFVSLCGVNIFELALMLSLSEPDSAFAFIVMYYNSAILSVLFFLHYILRLRNQLNKFISRGIVTLCLLAILCASIPGLALEGVESIGYSITRHPGPLYLVLQFTIAGGALASLLLMGTARRSEDVNVRRKATVLLIAISPLILAVVSVIVLMQFGLHVNATIVVSLATSFMMAVLFYAESKLRLFKLLALVPMTEEHRRWNSISHMLNDPRISLKEAQLRFSEMIVEDAMQRAQGSQIKAAKLLGTSRSTVYRYLASNDKKDTTDI